MRVQSASEAKGKRRGGPTQLEPREGTEIRALWQRFKDNPAIPVFTYDLLSRRGHGGALEALRNYYGLDIRPFDRKHPRKYWLVGEWFGKTYLDYVADRRAKEERAARKAGT